MRFLLFLFLLHTSIVIATPIEVSVDRDLINLNQSFEITFSSDKDPDANPDFSPLEKDFEILNQNHGSSMSWVNGKSSMKIQWTFTVIAKQAGQLQIPALDFGSDSSPPVFINVIENKAITTQSYDINAPIFLEVKATPTNPYLQSQVIYRLRFFRRVNIVEARLTDPELADAVVEKLGEDKNYKTNRGGMTYAVTERNYAIFPQKSGTMTIDPLKLTAAVLVDNGSRMGGFFGAQSTKRERVESNAITLEVRPVPAGFTGKHWLIAKSVELSQQWSGNYNAMQVGEPLTRTLTLTVNGTTMGQLPKLQQTSKEGGLKNYPDQANLKENKTTTGLIASRQEKIAFIPSKNGHYTLPEISVDWFNSETEQMETVTIPETMITAIGGVTTTTMPVINTNNVVKQPATLEDSKIELNSFETQSNHWFWPVISLFFAIAWLATLFVYFYKKPRLKLSKVNQPDIDLKSSIKALKQACNANDAQGAKQALLAWGNLKYDISSLGALTNHCEARLRDEILVLNQNLYSQHIDKWHGNELFQFFNEHKAREKFDSKVTDDKLEPLYRI